jgi:hypothetical protein
VMIIAAKIVVRKSTDLKNSYIFWKRRLTGSIDLPTASSADTLTAEQVGQLAYHFFELQQFWPAGS